MGLQARGSGGSGGVDLKENETPLAVNPLDPR